MQFNSLSCFSFTKTAFKLPPGIKDIKGYTHASKFLSNLMRPIFQLSSYIIFDSVKSWIYVFFGEDLHLADTNYNGSLSIFQKTSYANDVTQHHAAPLIQIIFNFY